MLGSWAAIAIMEVGIWGRRLQKVQHPAALCSMVRRMGRGVPMWNPCSRFGRRASFSLNAWHPASADVMIIAVLTLSVRLCLEGRGGTLFPRGSGADRCAPLWPHHMALTPMHPSMYGSQASRTQGACGTVGFHVMAGSWTGPAAPPGRHHASSQHGSAAACSRCLACLCRG